MAVQDDIRRLSEQRVNIYLGLNLFGACMAWHEGRLQQANDGSWIFRSSSRDGSIVAFTLGGPTQNWTSEESPTEGLTVFSRLLRWSAPKISPSPSDKCSCGSSYRKESLTRGFRIQIDGCRANAMIRGLPYPLQRGHCTSRSTTRIEASGSRGLTRKSKSMTVPQPSQLIISQ